MKFAPFAQAPTITGLIVLLVFLAIVVIIASFADSFIGVVVVAIALCIGVFASINYASEVRKAEDKTKSVATNNLRVKYDLKEVYWDARETTANPKDAESNENLVIEDLNGEKHIFKYEVNLETREPSLSDMPKAGGAADKPSVTADSLLQKAEEVTK